MYSVTYAFLTAALMDLGQISSVDAIVEGINDREAAIENVGADLTFDHTFAMPGDTNVKRARWRVAVTMEAAGRYRIEGESRVIDAAGQPQGLAAREIQVFNGNKRVQALGQETFSNGRVSAKAVPVILPFLPTELAWGSYNLQPIASQFKEGAKTVGTTEFDHQNVLVIESAVTEAANGRRSKVQYHVDPDRGFVVVRKAALVQDSPKADWRTYGLVELTELKEVTDGIWLPQRGLVELDALPLEGPAQVVSKSVVQIENWVVNASLPDSLFEWSFPRGVAVNDEITGTVYMSDAVTDKMIEEQARRATQLYRRDFSGWLWSAGAIAIGAVVLTAWLRRRRQSARARGET